MKYLYFFILLSFGLSGCVKNNALPVWLEINEWTLDSNPSSVESPGALTHNFSDVWIYVDGKVIGVFELPCKIPVLASGNCKVLLYPAIKNNGMASTKKIYPFAEPFETTLDLKEGDTYTFNPVTRYFENTKFWIEDFETNSIKFIKDASVSNANLNLEAESNSSIGPWGKYGHLALTSADSLWVGVQDLDINLSDPRELYAAAWYRTRSAWNFEESGKTSGIYKSVDGGNTWSLITKTPTPSSQECWNTSLEERL